MSDEINVTSSQEFVPLTKLNQFESSFSLMSQNNDVIRTMTPGSDGEHSNTTFRKGFLKIEDESKEIPKNSIDIHIEKKQISIRANSQVENVMRKTNILLGNEYAGLEEKT